MPLSNDLNQPVFHTQPAQFDGSESQNVVASVTHPRDPSGTRGRTHATLAMNNSALLPQQGGSGMSARSQSSAATTRSPALLSGTMERRPSLTQNPYRPVTKTHGPFQHSRNPSFVNSPTTSPLSPYPGANMVGNGSVPEFASLTMHQHGTPESRPNDSPLSASGSALSSTSTLPVNQDSPESSAISLNQRKGERVGGNRTRRAHSYHRSHSKHHASGEPKNAYEHSLIHLFNSFISQADFKINQCIVGMSEQEPQVEDICGPGVDLEFDRLLWTLGNLAHQKPKPLIDSVMYWRKNKGEQAHEAKIELNKVRSDLASGTALVGSLTPTSEENVYTKLPALEEFSIQAERRSSLSIYLLCRVLIEVYNQTNEASLTLSMAAKLEDIIFGQLKQTDPEQLISTYKQANWHIYCQLLGSMSRISFQTVARRFTSELRMLHNEAFIKSAITKEADGRIALLVKAMKYVRIKTEPEHAWEESCRFLHDLADFFANSHGPHIKFAYCQTLAELLFPIAASGSLFLGTLQWKEFLNVVNTRLSRMLTKAQYWPCASELSTLALCASPLDVFASQWLSAVTSLHAKLKEKSIKGYALQSICRLMWIYLDRVNEPISLKLRKIEDTIKPILPIGKKGSLSLAYAEPKVELIRMIGHWFPDFCFAKIVFPLINSEIFNLGREVKAEQLDPERMVIGIRAFLAVITDKEREGGGRPPFPRFSNGIISATPLIESQSLRGGYHVLSGRGKSDEAEQLSRPVVTGLLDNPTQGYYGKFCDLLGKITIVCDNAFGGQAVLDEKFASLTPGGLTPKTPISETFSFSRRDEHPILTDHRQGFYDLLHVAVQALPRCLSPHVPLNSLINLMCTGTAHVRSNIAISSAQSLKAIARQGHAQQVTIGFARFILNFDTRYSTMSDEGLLGPGHIENTLRLYVELLQIWIDETRQKNKPSTNELPDDSPSGGRGIPLDLTNVSTLVEEVESHGVFFLCSQSRRVRSYAVKVLKLVTEFDSALGKDHPRIIKILEGETHQIMDVNDEQLSVAERSRLQKGNRKSAVRDTMIELCSSEISYDSTLWFKIFPNLIRISFEICPFAITLGREIVSTRLQQMHDTIIHLAEKGLNARGPQSFSSETNPMRALARLGTTSPDVIVDQWKLYLVMACTTMTNAGAQTQSQLANSQHARKVSNKGAQQSPEKVLASSARQLFASVIPLLSAAPTSIRDAIVIALGSININLYRTLLESLQYAVTTCKEEAKLRIGTHHRSGSSPQRNRRTDLLRTEVTHVYRLTARFLRGPVVLQDDWILNNISTYTKDLMIFLSDAEIQNDWECQRLRRHYCGLLEELFDGINRTVDPARWMAFESRKSSFALMEDWCGYSPNQSRISQREDNMRQTVLDQHQNDGERTNVTAAMEIEKRNLCTAALSAMAALCAGPLRITTIKGDQLSFDIRRLLSWIDQIFGTVSDKMHLIGRRALERLIVHNRDIPFLLEHSIERCYAPERPRALESYFEVVTKVLTENDNYPLAFWRILGAILFSLGNGKASIRTKSARLLRLLEQRHMKNSKLQDFDISISDRTTAVYKLAQFEISKRLAKEHHESAFFVFSQFSLHFKNISADSQRSMVAAILPWIQTIELQLDPNGGPSASSYMLLANLLETTTKASGALHNEIQALWQALATGPHGGNVQLILDFVIALCLDRREQSFVDYAKQIVVYLSSTPAGQKVIEFLMLQITPKNMVQEKREPVATPPDILGLPYIADLAEALPIGNKQQGFSLGQLSLIFLVDLMVAPMHLREDNIPLLLQVVLILWDHYTLLVQEQAREMLVHLIHELVITRIEDNTTTPNKESIETFVESIRQNDSSVIWAYEDCNGKDDDGGNRVPGSMTHVTKEVVDLFAICCPNIQEQWAKITLSWATSCPVRHLACRSFQVFRCILTSLDQPMLADMLARLSNTIADEQSDYQTFSLEILTTLKTIINALEPSDLLRYPQLFWATCACLNTRYEREFVETLEMTEKLLEKVNLGDPVVIKLLEDAKPQAWQGTFEGIVPLLYKGFKSATSLAKTLLVVDKAALLPDNDLVGNQARPLFGILASLPCFLQSFEAQVKDPAHSQAAQTWARVAGAELADVLNAYASGCYTSSKNFLIELLSELKKAFFPRFEFRSLVFLLGVLSNRLSWYRARTLDALCSLMKMIDTRSPEITSQGLDFISPLLRLLTTEHYHQALEVMAYFHTMSSTAGDKDHLLMSMAEPSSRQLLKKYEKTQCLYGIPEDSGWSVPMPATHSSDTRTNMQAVFRSCHISHSDAITATPEVEFHAEDYHQGSYFPFERSDTFTSDDPRLETTREGSMGELVSRLDSLDDFFEDSLSSENRSLRPYSNSTITGPASSEVNGGAEQNDRQTEPILQKSLKRTASVTSLQNGFADVRSAMNRDPGIMSPAAFVTNPTPPNPLPPRPSLHSRSVTTPINNVGTQPNGIDSLTDEDTDDILSEDERSTGNGGSRTFGSSLRAVHNGMKKVQPGVSGKEYRQRDLLRGQSRSRSQAPHSPDVPKVPAAYLKESLKLPDS